jgi:uncharacterized damage-inducible protein DinB
MPGNQISVTQLFASDIRYSEWASRRLLDACATLTPEEVTRDLGVSHHTILATLQHIRDGERVWLDCLSTTAREETWTLPSAPAPELSLAELQEQWPELWKGYERWLNRLPNAASELEVEVFVQIPDGRVPRFRRWYILRHVLDHSQFHRGQVIAMIRTLGHTPPAINRGDYWLAGGTDQPASQPTGFHPEWFREDGGCLVIVAMILAILGISGLAVQSRCVSGIGVLGTDGFILLLLCEASLRYTQASRVKQTLFQFPHKFTSLFLVLFLLVALVCSFASFYLLSHGVHTSGEHPEPLEGRLNAAYFSMVTITTLGYGDYVPFNRCARFLVIFELLSGALLLIMAFPMVASRMTSWEGTKQSRGHMLPFY